MMLIKIKFVITLILYSQPLEMWEMAVYSLSHPACGHLL